MERITLIEAINIISNLYSEYVTSENDMVDIRQYDEELQDTHSLLEDLCEKKDNGLLVELPCKISEVLYLIQSGGIVQTEIVTKIECKNGKWSVIANNCIVIDFEDFGKTVFLTKEEAEAVLERL